MMCLQEEEPVLKGRKILKPQKIKAVCMVSIHIRYHSLQTFWRQHPCSMYHLSKW